MPDSTVSAGLPVAVEADADFYASLVYGHFGFARSNSPYLTAAVPTRSPAGPTMAEIPFLFVSCALRISLNEYRPKVFGPALNDRFAGTELANRLPSKEARDDG